MTEAQQTQVNGKTVSFRKIGTGKRRILFFHGFPGSSVQIDFFIPVVNQFDLEVICIDRPGYHRSEPAPQNHHDFILETNRAVTQTFGWNRFELLSVSGGTPYLFSFARAFPESISKIVILSGLMPVSTPVFTQILSAKTVFALKVLPFIHKKLLKLALPAEATASKPARASILSYLMPISLEDQLILKNKEHAAVLRQALREALMQGGDGPKRDAEYYLSPWSLDLPESLNKIDIWHGKSDLILPYAMAEKLAQQLARAKLHLVESEGHYSLAVNQVEKILS